MKLVVDRRMVEDTVDASECPFCKSNDLEIGEYHDPRDMLVYGYYVGCNRCYARGPKKMTKEAAVLYWNDAIREATPQQVSGEAYAREEFEKMVEEAPAPIKAWLKETPFLKEN